MKIWKIFIHIFNKNIVHLYSSFQEHHLQLASFFHLALCCHPMKTLLPGLKSINLYLILESGQSIISEMVPKLLQKLEKRFLLIFPNALVSCAGHIFLGISKHSWEVLAHMTKHWQRISWQILSTCNGLSWMKIAFIMCTICWSKSTWTSTHPSSTVQWRSSSTTWTVSGLSLANPWIIRLQQGN